MQHPKFVPKNETLKANLYATTECINFPARPLLLPTQILFERDNGKQDAKESRDAGSSGISSESDDSHVAAPFHSWMFLRVSEK